MNHRTRAQSVRADMVIMEAHRENQDAAYRRLALELLEKLESQRRINLVLRMVAADLRAEESRA